MDELCEFFKSFYELLLLSLDDGGVYSNEISLL